MTINATNVETSQIYKRKRDIQNDKRIEEQRRAYSSFRPLAELLIEWADRYFQNHKIEHFKGGEK